MVEFEIRKLKPWKAKYSNERSELKTAVVDKNKKGEKKKNLKSSVDDIV